MKETNGLIFDIQGFSVHDGPGCRTTVFLKGCPLQCKWCANPEGILPHPEIMRYRQDVKISETWMTVEKLMKRIQKDRQYWGSGGGITLSGGEPMFQIEFIAEILKKCCDSYIHTAIETSGCAPWEYYEKVLEYLDWIFFDLKHMDSAAHKKGTGLPNELILENARKIAASGNYRMVFRMPIIPGFNDSRENILATAKFIKETGKKEVNILPFHNLGMSKYDLLGKKYACKDIRAPTPKKMEEIKNIFEKCSVRCHIGSNTPF